MTNAKHETLVQQQFGDKANAYLLSAVHASGADLEWLRDKLADLAPARLLDLGCGGGHVTYLAAPLARSVVAYDLAPEMLTTVAGAAAARGLGNVTTKQGKAESIDFPDASFDVVTCRFSAHHWSDLDAGLREVRRVLKPGGTALFIDVMSPGTPLLDTFLQTIEIVRDPSHVRDYSMAEWLEALARARLHVAKAEAHRLHIDFAIWVERMQTEDTSIACIRSLQDRMPAEVRQYYEVTANGDFNFDTIWLTINR